MLKTVLLNNFSETLIILLGFFNEYKVQNKSIYLKKVFFNIINVFTISFDQFNASKLNKIIALYCNFLLKGQFILSSLTFALWCQKTWNIVYGFNLIFLIFGA